MKKLEKLLDNNTFEANGLINHAEQIKETNDTLANQLDTLNQEIFLLKVTFYLVGLLTAQNQVDFCLRLKY